MGLHTAEFFSPPSNEPIVFALALWPPLPFVRTTKSGRLQSLRGLEWLADSVLMLGLAFDRIPSPCVVRLSLKWFRRQSYPFGCIPTSLFMNHQTEAVALGFRHPHVASPYRLWVRQSAPWV